MKKCLKCQYENPPGAKFCNNCGTSLVEETSGSTKRPAERRQLTILFCDLVDSTPLSEQLDPEDYRHVITSYHEVAEKVVKKYNGYIAQYLGDGLLVYFGYPEGLEDAPKLGIQAGLNILEAMANANRQWEAENRRKVKVRIGIHTGLVVVDDHLALGETVNIAARLEGLAPHNGLVISPQTLSLAQGWFEVKNMGKHMLKGISEPMEIFQVLHQTAVKTRLDIAKSRGLSPLVGREKELHTLIDGWEKAKKGDGNVVFIGGEPGIGKSRLVDTLEGQIASDRECWAAIARCSEYQRNSAFYPLIEWLEGDLLEFETSDDPPRKLHKLEQFLKSGSLDQRMAMPLFAEFLSIPSEHHMPLMISPAAKRQRIIEALTQVMLDKASDQAVLFALEDLHWADASTLEWLMHFIPQIVKKNILIICSARPSFQPAWNGHSNIVREITLQRLSPDALKAICHHQTKGKALPKDILKQISLKTDGVPLFVEELTKMIIESDLMVEKSDGFEVVGSISSMSIPSTLQDSLLARLDKLSNAREIVQIASVLGRQFSEMMLKAVVPQMELRMTESLSQLIEAEIFYRRDLGKQSGFEFKHALIQDAAYESLLKSRRQQLHHKVAEVLEQQFVETTQTQPELLAHHYTEAAQPLKALPIWLQAGQLASQKNAALEAIAHLEKGIALLPHITSEADRNNLELDFRLVLGGTYVVSHGFPHPKVKETFDRARDIAQSIEVNPKLALVLFNLLSYYFNTEDFKAHKALSDHMMKLAKDGTNGYWFELCGNQILGVTNAIQGNFAAANLNFERILEMFNPSLPFPWELAPSGYIEIGAKSWQMVCLQILGLMDQAKFLSDKHVLFTGGHKDSMTQYHIHTFPALLALVRRSWKDAEVIIEEYLPVVRAFGDPVFILTAEVYYHIAKAFLGDRASFDAAVNLTNVCFDVGFTAFAVTMSSYIGELYCRIGEHQSAFDWVEKILVHVNRTGSHINTAELYRIKGVAQLAIGGPEVDVEKSFDMALSVARKQSAKTYELRAAGELARLWEKQGKSRAGHDLLKEVHDWFTEGKDSIDLEEARITLSQLKK